MEFSFFKGAVWQLLTQMDWIAISILIGLFCLSVLCVAIVVFKFCAFRRQQQQFTIFFERFRHVKNMSQLISISKDFKDHISGQLLSKNLQELRQILDTQSKKKPLDETSEASITLTSKELEPLELSVNQTIDRLLFEEEAYLPILATSASAAPLIGLFGTIWGLVHAFVDISQEKSADIATVAPGMAEALIVTLAGLVVAIPALVAFHYFSHQLRKTESNLCMIGDKFLSTVRYTFVK